MRYIIILLAFMAACNEPDVKMQFDDLEKVFDTGNWRVMGAKDTSYLFFSREGERLFKVYSYVIKDGDSVSSKITIIEAKAGKIIWGNNELISTTDKESVWKNNDYYKKRDSLHIDATHAVLLRTLPISTFLVRSKYDHLHGTHTADATVDTARRRH